MERASRVFCESTLANQYATLVCGKADSQGEIEICNAGHLPSIVLRELDTHCVNANGLPLGLFCVEEFSVDRISLKNGDFLVLLTDGLSEAQNPSGSELGIQPFIEMLQEHPFQSASELVDLSTKIAGRHRAGIPANDDLTLLVLERTE
jgi:sigma-B regulation protein RsbU (phosphoserine phosphatase)